MKRMILICTSTFICGGCSTLISVNEPMVHDNGESITIMATGPKFLSIERIVEEAAESGLKACDSKHARYKHASDISGAKFGKETMVIVSVTCDWRKEAIKELKSRSIHVRFKEKKLMGGKEKLMVEKQERYLGQLRYVEYTYLSDSLDENTTRMRAEILFNEFQKEDQNLYRKAFFTAAKYPRNNKGELIDYSVPERKSFVVKHFVYTRDNSYKNKLEELDKSDQWDLDHHFRKYKF